MTNAVQMFDPSMLESVAIPKAPIVLLYAENGVGKSTFLTTIPHIIVADIEGKLNNTNVARFTPGNYEQFKTWLEWLLFQDKLEFKAVGIDSADWLLSLIDGFICKNTGASSISDPYVKATGFSNGYIMAANILKNDVLRLIAEIRDKHNVPFIIVCHAHIVKREDPDVDPYDQYDLKLEKRSAAILSERVEAKVFAKIIREKDAKGNLIPTDKRAFICSPQKGISAKNNLKLPDTFEVTESNGWQDFLNALNTKQSTN